MRSLLAEAIPESLSARGASEPNCCGKRSIGTGKAFLTGSVLAMLLSACGGSGTGNTFSDGTNADSQSTGTMAQTGSVYISMTDDEGDFLSYTVDIQSIILTEKNGDTVEILPESIRVDFTDYVDLSELLSVQNVPVGSYENVSINVDYSTAEIIVQDNEGTGLLASAVDSEGVSLTSYQLKVVLDEENALVVSSEGVSTLSIDFDLEASNEIISYDPATVEVDPILIVSAKLNAGGEHRIRGVLDSSSIVNEQDGAHEFSANIIPFENESQAFGNVKVKAAETTVFDINKSAYEGYAGLDALAKLDSDEVVVVYGEFDTDYNLLADTVLAGSSVISLESQSVEGVIVGRNGLQLTLNAAYVKRGGENKESAFNETVVVSLSENTSVVFEDNTYQPQTVADLSIGQAVRVFGDLTDVDGVVAVDAVAGHVQLFNSSLTGEVLSVEPLVVDVDLLNIRREGIYDFSGTGVENESDSDPDAYEIATGALSLTNLEVGDYLRVLGNPAPFGTAPSDFTAASVEQVNTDVRASVLGALWVPARDDAVTEASDSQLVLDLSHALLEEVVMPGLPSDVINPQSSYVIVPATEHKQIYFIKTVAGELQVFDNFGDFTAEFNDKIAAGKLVVSIETAGEYTQEHGELKAVEVSVRMK